MANTKRTRKLSFINGLEDAKLANEVGFNGAVRANNVDFTIDNRVISRPGRSLVLSLSGIEATWSDGDNSLVQADGVLYKLTPGPAVQQLYTGLTRTNLLCGVASPDGSKLFWSNGQESGTIGENIYPFGVERPFAPKLGVDNEGSLSVGRYNVALAFVRVDGVTSGVSVGSSVFLSQKGRIIINLPTPSHSSITNIDVYVTKANGSEYYFFNRVSLSSTCYISAAYDDELHNMLGNIGGNAMPYFVAADIYNGRLLISVDGYFYYSQVYAYELFYRARNYIQFPGAVTEIIAVEDGVYVGTDKGTYFLLGKDVASAELLKVDSSSIVPGTVVFGAFGENEQAVAWCTSEDGFVVADEKGNVTNISRNKVLPTIGASRGSAYLRNTNGREHLITVLNT